MAAQDRTRLTDIARKHVSEEDAFFLRRSINRKKAARNAASLAEGEPCVKLGYKHTTIACYLGMISQAIVNNLAPLLFIIFKDEFHVSDEQLGRLILFNFGTQIIADILATRFADRMGYRMTARLAEAFCAIGLIMMSIFPRVMADPYAGLCVAAVLYALGGGLIEVVISPIIESLPGDAKDKAMSLAHSFYCWGQMAVVIFTTLALKAFGRAAWTCLPLVWAVVPAGNFLLFRWVPLMPTVPEEKRTRMGELFKNRVFIIGMVMMVCSGSSELAMSQWSSLFVEETLGVSKTMGDLLGPCMFALTMALGRMLYGIKGDKINLERMLMLSAGLCVVCYALAVFVPALTLVGCALCGLSVAIMWPGTLSDGAKRFPMAGTALFGLYAICGDIGCSVGPWLTGLVSDLTQNSESLLAWGQSVGMSAETMGLRAGLLVAAVFPLLLLICTLLLARKPKESR